MKERMREWVVVAKDHGWMLMRNLGQRNAYTVREEGSGAPDYQRGIGRQQAVMTYRLRVLTAKQAEEAQA
jgi:hypothetical protein